MTDTVKKHVCPRCQHEFPATPKNSGRFTTCEKCGFMFKSEAKSSAGEKPDGDWQTELRAMNQNLSSIANTLRAFLMIFLILVGLNLLVTFLAFFSR